MYAIKIRIEKINEKMTNKAQWLKEHGRVYDTQEQAEAAREQIRAFINQNQ